MEDFVTHVVWHPQMRTRLVLISPALLFRMVLETDMLNYMPCTFCMRVHIPSLTQRHASMIIPTLHAQSWPEPQAG